MLTPSQKNLISLFLSKDKSNVEIAFSIYRANSEEYSCRDIDDIIKILSFADEYVKEKIGLWISGYDNEYFLNSTHSITIEWNPDKIITKLPIKFGEVSGSFECANGFLTTLEGCPYFVGFSFDCSNNLLTDLKHSPRKVRCFYCPYNFLTSLKGCPSELAVFDCHDNLLENIDFFPSIEIFSPLIISSDWGRIDLSDNNSFFTEEYIRSVWDCGKCAVINIFK